MDHVADRLRYKTVMTIKRYPTDAHYLRDDPQPCIDAEGVLRDAISVHEGNVLLNEGITGLFNLMAGVGSACTKWDNGNARIGVGDNNTAAANSQTGLSAPTNKEWAAMANSYPSAANQTITFQAAFGANNANWGWNEFTVTNAANDTGVNLNRVVSAQGTKTAGQTWTVSIQITLS